MQAKLLVLGFVVVLISVALALLPRKSDEAEALENAQPAVKETKAYLAIASVLFFALTLIHALRLNFAWTATVGGWAVPKWPSWLALIVNGLLALWAIRLRKRFH
jgi:hypothetical protein